MRRRSHSVCKPRIGHDPRSATHGSFGVNYFTLGAWHGLARFSTAPGRHRTGVRSARLELVHAARTYPGPVWTGIGAPAPDGLVAGDGAGRGTVGGRPGRVRTV